MTSSINSVEALNRQVETFQAHDAAAFAALYSADAVLFDPAYPEPLRGQMEIEQDLRDLFTVLPDVRIQVTRVLEDGSLFAVEYTLSGTQDGPLKLPAQTVPPTGRWVELHAANFTRTDGEGRIVEERRYYDVAGQLAQFGLSA